jgi:hypothetical protein
MLSSTMSENSDVARGLVPLELVEKGGQVPTGQAPDLAPPPGGFNTPPEVTQPQASAETLPSEGD